MSTIPAPFEVDLGEIMLLPEEERERELGKIASLKQILEANPLWRYFPHEGERGWKLDKGLPLDGDEFRGQQQFHEIDLYEGAYVGGNRSGKTHGGLADLSIQSLPVHFIPPWLLKYRTREREDREYFGRLVGVDLSYWLLKAMLPKMRHLIPAAALWGGNWQKAWRERERTLYFDDGTWWDFLTHDMDIDSFASAELDRVWFDEEPPGEKGKQQFEESEFRLIDRGGDIRITMTPLFGMSWLYYELTDDQGNPRDDEDCRVVVGDIDHNPHLSDAHRTRTLKRIAKDPLKLAARKSGHWVHFAGMVYEEWDERRHVVADREIPRSAPEPEDPTPRELAEWRRAKPIVPVYETIDPGIAVDHPAAFSVGFVTPEDELELFHTHRIYGGTAEDMAQHIHETRAEFGYRPRWTVIDPKADSRDHQTGKSTRDAYRKHGIHTILGQNSVEAGINAVKERLRTDRLRVQQRCAEFLDEIPNYRWKGNKRSRSDDAAKPEVIKRKDDVLDTVRYKVMSLGRPPKRPDPDKPLRTAAEQAFDASLKALRRRGRKRGRIGGVI